MKKGKFIVIDGTDGSGKATQVKLLVSRLKKQRIGVKTIDFPQYKKNFFGKMVGRYLSGEFGSSFQVSPYLASILYAADRFECKERIGEWLLKGFVVIADRYASSNQIHQGGKINSHEERKKFLAWLEKMEFKIFSIPRPDAIFYLDVPLEFSLDLLKNKSAQNRKKYLNGKADIHESDQRHLICAKQSAIDLVKKNNNWVKINCVKNGLLLSKKEVNDLVWEQIKNILK
jgi:dTMP kinase